MTSPAPQDWDQARQYLTSYWARLRRVSCKPDPDRVLSGYGWTLGLLLKEHVRISCALKCPRDNPQMERSKSRLITENRSLILDAQTLDQLTAVVVEGRHSTTRTEGVHLSAAEQPRDTSRLCAQGRSIRVPRLTDFPRIPVHHGLPLSAGWSRRLNASAGDPRGVDRSAR
jgi:hypothetical protein